MEALATLRYKFGGGLRVIGGGGAGLSDGVGSPSYRVLAGIDYFPECKGPTQGRLIVRVQTEDGLPVIATLKGKGPSGALAPKGSVAKPFEVKTDSTGTYNVKTDPGEYAVVALAPGYLPGSAKGTVLISKTTEVVITLALKKQPTTLQVNVVYKATGEPINNSALLIKNSATGKLEAKKLPTGTWSGEYAPGDYLLSGIAQGYERVDQPATVLPNKANTATLELRQIILQIGNIQFDYDSANIKVESYPILEDVLDKIRIKQAQTDTEIQKIIIEGHTSSEGTEEYNQNLSQRRAESVRNWLVEHGVAADLLDPRGYGESRPIADNETEEGRMKNRRVEFIFEETGGAGLSSPGAAGVEGGPTEVTGDTEPGQEPAAETPAPEGGEAAPEGGEAAPEGGEAAPEGGEAAPEGGETP
ncbi:OmpA family protein [bacterium]|nr:OmpA family protein [bacterium]